MCVVGREGSRQQLRKILRNSRNRIIRNRTDGILSYQFNRKECVMERIVDIPSDIETIKVGLNDPLFTKMLTGFPVREEIIRCRDCKQSKCYNGSWLCLLLHVVDGDPAYVESWTYLETEPDDFCAWAERREDG